MELNQITVPVRDLKKSISFYEKLGLRLIVKSLPTYARFECPNGNSTFSLHKADKLPSGAGVTVYLECAELDNQVTNLKKKGIVFEEPPTDRDWLWPEARLKDPDGNQLILYFAGENRLNPPWKITSK